MDEQSRDSGPEARGEGSLPAAGADDRSSASGSGRDEATGRRVTSQRVAGFESFGYDRVYSITSRQPIEDAELDELFGMAEYENGVVLTPWQRALWQDEEGFARLTDDEGYLVFTYVALQWQM